jgi:hypothetical protein
MAELRAEKKKKEEAASAPTTTPNKKLTKAEKDAAAAAEAAAYVAPKQKNPVGFMFYYFGICFLAIAVARMIKGRLLGTFLYSRYFAVSTNELSSVSPPPPPPPPPPLSRDVLGLEAAVRGQPSNAPPSHDSRYGPCPMQCKNQSPISI